MTHILEKLARARAAQVDAATALEQVTQANSALLVRMAESRAKSEEAVRETKANGDPDGKWAMQLRLALDDQADIKSMLTGSQAVLNERSAAASAATSAAHSTESAARTEETEIQAKELDDVIRVLDAKLCEAVQRRMACQNIMHPSKFGATSCFKFYQASSLLKNIVTHSQVSAGNVS
ncbi:hypothetical protein SBC1_14550 [Caballeronia sp. SBC1]|uniref:hypothetical protein n=1 Tax=Caballeronia sp. SBC1 TaxID=2705548 RepID=UPI00140D4CC4|nr:hypothetical protein [Caballeronia sp. SBC1]QIN61463.1 hypothetical protein SBC1_14550 [Caballeronia sp. SBC1]